MKKEDLFWAIGDVDDRLLERSEVPKRSSVIVKKAGATAAARSPRYGLLHKWVSAACLLLAVSILIATLVIGGKYGFHLPPLGPLPSGNHPGNASGPDEQTGHWIQGPESTPPVTTEEPVPDPPIIMDWTIPEDFLATPYNWETPGLEPLSEELRREIEYTWYVNEGYRFHWLNSENIVTRHSGIRYLGTYNGYVMLFRPTEIYNICTWSFAEDITFNHYMEFELIGYKENTFYSVNGDLPTGFAFLSEADLRQMQSYHYTIEQMIQFRTDLDDPFAYQDLYFPELEPLSEETIQMLEDAWFAQNGYALDWYGENKLNGPRGYLGTYNDCIVFGISYWACVAENQIIGGIIFNTGGYTVYKDGAFYELYDAYNLGLIPADRLIEIAYHFKVFEKGYQYEPFDWTIPADFLATPYNWETPGLEPLSEDLRREIEYTWYVNEGYRFHWLDSENIVTRHYGMRYLGTYNGYVMLFRPTNTYGDSLDYLTEQRLPVTHYMGYEIIGYKENAFYRKDLPSLQNGYSFLDVEDITQMIDYHNTIESMIQSRSDLDDPLVIEDLNLPALERLSEEQTTRLNWKQNANGDPRINWEMPIVKNWTWTYYGEYSGAQVCFQPTMLPMEEAKIVGGNLFEFSYRFHIWVYTDAARYSLEDAFNQGILTLEDLEIIAYRHAKHTGKALQEPTPVHPDPNREKKDILSIPGAMLVENPTFVASGQDPKVQYVSTEEYIQSLRRSFFVALGEIENPTCYLVEEERKVWYIFTFDLKITEGITNIEGTDTIHCITTCYYWGTKSETNECPLMKKTLDIVTNSNGLYVFSAASEAIEDEINGVYYNWGDYADYYLGVRYDVAENGFYFVGEKINFEDIRK